MSADVGEAGFAGAGLVDEFAVEYHHQTIQQFQPFIKIFADRRDRAAVVATLPENAPIGLLPIRSFQV